MNLKTKNKNIGNIGKNNKDTKIEKKHSDKNFDKSVTNKNKDKSKPNIQSSEPKELKIKARMLNVRATVLIKILYAFITLQFPLWYFNEFYSTGTSKFSVIMDFVFSLPSFLFESGFISLFIIIFLLFNMNKQDYLSYNFKEEDVEGMSRLLFKRVAILYGILSAVFLLVTIIFG